MDYFCYVDYCTIIMMCAVFHNSCLSVFMLRCTPTQKRMLAILFRNLSLTFHAALISLLFPRSG